MHNFYYYSFTVCFLVAAPPIGEKRFAYPQYPIPWKETLNKKDYGDICLQSQPTNFPESENCLTLNVFVPTASTPTSNLPVVLWLAGGAYNSGSARSLNLPSFVSQGRRIGSFIGVSMNYRVSNFFSLSDNSVFICACHAYRYFLLAWSFRFFTFESHKGSESSESWTRRSVKRNSMDSRRNNKVRRRQE